MSDETKGSVALRVATALAAAGAAAAGGPVGALVGAGMKEVVDALFDTIYRRRLERATRMIEIGVQASGAAVDRFSETIEDSPALLALLAATVEAAMETPLEEKVYALGGCLGRAAADQARVDAEMLRVRGLARIDNAEVKLMALLSEQPGWIPKEHGESREPKRWLGWRREEILQRLPGFAGVLDASLARLVAEGLAFNAGLGTWASAAGQEQWALTDFGHDCLHLLEATRQFRVGTEE